jgi:hypothetical protein
MTSPETSPAGTAPNVRAVKDTAAPRSRFDDGGMQMIYASFIISTTRLAVIHIATVISASRKTKRLESEITGAVADASLMRSLSFSLEARGVNVPLSKSNIVLNRASAGISLAAAGGGVRI